MASLTESDDRLARHREYQRKHVEKKGAAVYRAERTEYERKRRLATQVRMWEWLADKTCADCASVTDPRCLEFDHVRGVKAKNLAELVSRGAAWQTIMAEVDKCEVVCANCHRIRTSVQRGWNVEQWIAYGR